MPKQRVVGDKDARGRARVQTGNWEPSMTVQSDAHLADIQNIMKSYGVTGMADLDEAAMQFADITQFTDLADALNQAKDAEREFLKMPSKVREVFNHDVAVWLDTAHDEDKRDALIALGFLKPREVVEPVGVTGAPGDPEPGPDPEGATV